MHAQRQLHVTAMHACCEAEKTDKYKQFPITWSIKGSELSLDSKSSREYNIYSPFHKTLLYRLLRLEHRMEFYQVTHFIIAVCINANHLAKGAVLLATLLRSRYSLVPLYWPFQMMKKCQPHGSQSDITV